MAKYAIPSFIDATFIHRNQNEHEGFWTERDANARAIKYWQESIYGFSTTLKPGQERPDWNGNPIEREDQIRSRVWYEYAPVYYPWYTFFTNLF